jgi:hypothetical protein
MTLTRAALRRLLVGRLSWWRVPASLASVYACLNVYGCLRADRMIFLPPAPSYMAGPEIVRVPTAGGAAIATLHLPQPAARYTVLYSHGNAEDLGHLRFWLEAFPAQGFAVFAYDYEGYGASGGTPSETATYRDIRAAYRHLTTELGVPPERVLLLGRSVGGGPAVDLAAEYPVGGLILQSSFVSAFRVVTRIPFFACDKFRNQAKLRRVRAPVLVIHGLADEIIPAWHGEKLFAAAPWPKMAYWVAGAGHNDLEDVAGPAYWETLRAFAERCAAMPPAQ